MKKYMLILILISNISIAYATGNKCYYNCTTEVTEVIEVTNVNNTTQEYYLDDSSIQKAIEQSAAQSAALETLMPTQEGKTRFNVLGATYRGEQAIGVTAVHRFTEGRTLEVGCAYSDGTLCRAGGGFEF